MNWNCDNEWRYKAGVKTACTVAFALLFGCAGVAQQPRKVSSTTHRVPSTVELMVDTIKPTPFGYEVTVRIVNRGKRSVTLAATAQPTGIALQSLDVEQWDDAVGWESAGPCSDVPPSATVTLQSKSTMWQVVPIFEENRACPRSIIGLHNRVRAVLHFVYDDQRAFERHKPASQNIVSKAVELPQSSDTTNGHESRSRSNR